MHLERTRYKGKDSREKSCCGTKESDKRGVPSAAVGKYYYAL
jgi:hypothetical protein